MPLTKVKRKSSFPEEEPTTSKEEFLRPSDPKEIENDDSLWNVVNEEDADSSDSDREIESEEELGFVEEYNSERDTTEDEATEKSDADDEENESENADEAVDNTSGDEDVESDDEDSGEELASNEDVSAESDSDGKSHESQAKQNSISETQKDTANVSNRKSKLFKNQQISRKGTNVQTKDPNDEYAEYDSSDEEDIRNTIGNVPMNWYDEYRHLGYDWDGNKIAKAEGQDQLDSFLKRIDDPNFWRTVKDPQTGQDVVLSDEEVKLIRRIQGQKIPDETFDEYAPWIEWFTSKVMTMPIRKFPEQKRSFLPSRDEAKKVSKLVHALKMGWIKTKEEQDKLRAKKEPQFYMLWQTDDQAEDMRRIHKHIAAPKRHLPGHAESYNPPSEYLFDAKELKQWNKYKEAPWKRKLHFIPQKFDSLRKVPAYSRFIKERFLRCLDLYLCPRAIKMKLTIQPEALVPKLPSPRDLQPFPTVLAIEYLGHSDMVRSIDTEKSGQFLVSGSDDCTVKIWEINTGRCLKTVKTDLVVRSVKWCPNPALSLILIASGNKVILLNPHVGDSLVCSKTDSVLKELPASDVIINERVLTTVQWREPTEEEYAKGYRAVLTHFKEITQVTWHGKGDYFASVMPDGQNRSVLISQVSKRRSQLPFSKPKGLVQCVLFHPSKPFLFVATQRHVRIYDLMKQMLIKKLMSNCKWISTMDIHPGGDNLLVGTYDRKVLWFDLDLSTKPYQILRLHGTAVRGIAYHKRYPLFASGSDDRSLIISHGMVYNDLLQNPLIVPLKRLQNHTSFNDFGIFGVHFHPLQPWVFSCGADSTIKLYSN